MKLEELYDYITSKKDLTKMTVDIEIDAETVEPQFYVMKTKETYVYGDESEQEAKIDEVRQDPGFAGVDKKFKEGKISKKSGEMLSPDTYTVVAKITH